MHVSVEYVVFKEVWIFVSFHLGHSNLYVGL